MDGWTAGGRRRADSGPRENAKGNGKNVELEAENDIVADTMKKGREEGRKEGGKGGPPTE